MGRSWMVWAADHTLRCGVGRNSRLDGVLRRLTADRRNTADAYCALRHRGRRTHADRHGRPRAHGRQHRPPAHAAWPHVRGVRPRSRAGAQARGRGRDGVREPRRAGAGARGAARGVGHAAGGRMPPRPRSPSLPRCWQPGDTLIDGGNTFWKDDVRRARELAPKGIRYLDVGTSGGVWGLERGYCLMIGGDKAVVERLDPIFAALAPGKGRHSRDARPRRPRPPRRAGLPARRPQRRRALRQDDPQRHRVRHDAGDRRGLRHPEERRLAASCRPSCGSTSTWPTSPRSGGAAASSPPGCST